MCGVRGEKKSGAKPTKTHLTFFFTSGVQSRTPNPVPPVVRTRCRSRSSHQWVTVFWMALMSSATMAVVSTLYRGSASTKRQREGPLVSETGSREAVSLTRRDK